MSPRRWLFRSSVLLTLVWTTLGTPPIVFTNTEEDCQACCDAAADAAFDGNFCRVQGCVKTVDVNGVEVAGQAEFGFECDDINVDFLNVQRRGCELGRDFRLLGSSDVLGNGVQFCNQGAVEATVAPVPAPTFGPIPAASCVSCCNTLDADFDQNRGVAPFANDFQRNRCEDACNADINCNNFRSDQEHRRRLGCAMGQDILEVGTSFLRDIEFICDAAGNVIIVVDDNGNNDDELIIIIASSVGGGVLLLAVFSVIMVRRRRRKRREKDIMRPVVTSDANWMDTLYGVRSGVYSMFSRGSRGRTGQTRDDLY